MIYFIEAVGAGLVKIGFTERDVEQRLKELQTGCPHKLRTLATMEGNATEEAELHLVLAHLRANGEWFRLEGELRLLVWLVPRVFAELDELSRDISCERQRASEHIRQVNTNFAAVRSHLYPSEPSLDGDGSEMSEIQLLKERVTLTEYSTSEIRRRVRQAEEDILSVDELLTVVSVRVFPPPLTTADAATRCLGGDCRAWEF